MTYSLIVFSNTTLDIKSQSDMINFEVIFLNTHQLKNLKRITMEPEVIVLNLQNIPDAQFLAQAYFVSPKTKKILLVDVFDPSLYVTFKELNISSITTDKTKLNSLIMKAIYEYNLENIGNKIYIRENLLYETQNHKLIFNNDSIKLSSLQLRFFEYMLLNANHVMFYDDIINSVWNNNNIPLSASSLKNLVSFFNKITPNLIENHYGVGYKLSLNRTLDYKNAKVQPLQEIYFMNKMINEQRESPQIVIDNVLEKIRDLFHCDRVCLCTPIDLAQDYFYVEYLVSNESHESVKKIKVDMTPIQYKIISDLLNTNEPIFYNEKEMLNAAIETKVFIEDGHRVAKSILICLLKVKNQNWAFALHQCSYERYYDETEIWLFKNFAQSVKSLLDML